MRIPRYWSRATHSQPGLPPATALGWSSESQSAADRNARERAVQAAAARAENSERTYPYGDRLLCEEIIEELEGGLITRNRYGALVLNTDGLFFADIDFPAVRARGVFDALLLMSSSARAARGQAIRDETRGRVEDWLRRRHVRDYRLYQTAAGLRLMLIDRSYDPTDPTTARILEELGADERYRALTRAQACFRARLTPKPWRCGVPRPPTVFPWKGRAAEAAYREWERIYADGTRERRACELIAEEGAPAGDALSTLADLHDHHACRPEAAVLA